MAHPVGIGIVGCGKVMDAYVQQIDKLQKEGRAELLSACDVATGAREKVLDRFGIPRFTSNYQEVIQQDGVDLVLVLTSMREHGPIAKAALEAGKHVLVEKPMAVTTEEAAELVELSRDHDRLLLPAPHVVLSPTFQTIWKRIDAGDIGPVLSARGRYGHGGPSWGPWFYKQGGGPIFDLGVYNITSLTGLLGPVKRVMAMTGIAIPEREVDGEKVQVESEDNAQILLDFGGSVFAAVTTGFTIRGYRGPGLELYGSEGTIQMMGDDWSPDGYEFRHVSRRVWEIHSETDRFWPWTDGVNHLVDCIERGTRPLITPEHGYHVLEVMVQAQASGRDGRARDITSTFPALPLSDTAEPEPTHPDHDRSRQK